jgi:hypothetical protein
MIEIERDTGGNSIGETAIENRFPTTKRSERAKEIPIKFEKYEGKTERVRK